MAATLYERALMSLRYRRRMRPFPALWRPVPYSLGFDRIAGSAVPSAAAPLLLGRYSMDAGIQRLYAAYIQEIAEAAGDVTQIRGRPLRPFSVRW